MKKYEVIRKLFSFDHVGMIIPAESVLNTTVMAKAENIVKENKSLMNAEDKFQCLHLGKNHKWFYLGENLREIKEEKQ